MKRLLLFIAVLLSPLSTLLAQPVAITNVTVIDVAAGEPLHGMTVVVNDDRITDVDETDAVTVPSSAHVIDGSGKFLIPGLWDMHAHASSDRITREFLYPLYIANGVTGFRHMKGDCFEAGAHACTSVESSIQQVKAQQQAVVAGDIVGPRVVASSVFADGSRKGSSVQAPTTEVHARAFVRVAQERGADFIKIYTMIPRTAYFALADEASRVGLPFAGHVPLAVRASEASDAGQRSIEHAAGILEECSAREDELRSQFLSTANSDTPQILPIFLGQVESFDAEKCGALYDRLAKNRTWVVPTLIAHTNRPDFREDPRWKYVPPLQRDFLVRLNKLHDYALGTLEGRAPYSQMLYRITGEMKRAGVHLLAGSDAGIPGVFWGWALHEELEALVEAGLTEAEALRAATLGPAEYLNATESLGTVERGKQADLVLLDANPLEDIRNTQRVRAVVARGRLFDRDALDALLTTVELAAESRDR